MARIKGNVITYGTTGKIAPDTNWIRTRSFSMGHISLIQLITINFIGSPLAHMSQ